ELQNAEWALSNTTKDIKAILDAAEDDYFRERRSDIDFVGERIQRNLLGMALETPEELETASILVAADLSPADTAMMQGQPGTWAILVALGNTGRFLGRFEVSVVTADQLEADLELRNLQLMVRQAGRWQSTRNVLTDVESFAPIGIIRPRTYPPHLYGGLEVAWGLTREDTGETTDLLRIPIVFDNGQMSLGQADVPVAGAPMAEKTGNWRLGVWAGDRSLGDLRFTLLSPEAACAAVVLRRFDLVASSRSGRMIKIKSVVNLSQVRSVAPFLAAETEFPCGGSLKVSVGILVDGTPVGEMEEQVVFHDGPARLTPGEFILPPIEAGRSSYKCSFVASVGEHCLGVREIEVHRGPPPGTDAQGRISDADRRERTEYATEAALITGQAHVTEHRTTTMGRNNIAPLAGVRATIGSTSPHAATEPPATVTLAATVAGARRVYAEVVAGLRRLGKRLGDRLAEAQGDWVSAPSCRPGVRVPDRQSPVGANDAQGRIGTGENARQAVTADEAERVLRSADVRVKSPRNHSS
ncbi:MAG: hypothetical protein WCK05_10715, partial [Planctomycetota bacterium]